MTADPPENRLTEISKVAGKSNGLGLMWLLFLGCVTLFGLMLRMRHLGAQSLWMDEAATAAISSLDWSSFWRLIFSREMNMSAYYCIPRIFPFLLHSEALLRLPSVVFGCGLIVAVSLLAEELVEDRRAVIISLASALLIALNGFLIAYSQEARGYAMAVFFLVLSTYASVVVLKTQRLRVTWCLLALAAIYSHLYAVLWIVPQAWVIWKTHRPLGWKFFRKIVAFALPGMIPLIVFAVRTRGGQLDWVPKLTLPHLLEVFVQIAGYSPIALLILCLGSALGCLHLWRRGDAPARLLVLENVFPVSLLLVCSPIHPLLVPRFLIFAIPFLTITAIVGFANLPMPWGSLAFASLLLVMLVVGNRSPAKGDWKSMTQYLCSQSGQAVAFWPPMQRFPYWYYSRLNSACPKPLSSPGGEIALSDFAGNKRDFAVNLCRSEEQSIVMVMESDWEKRIPATVTSCYAPVAVTIRDRLQLVRLRRLAPSGDSAVLPLHSYMRSLAGVPLPLRECDFRSR